MGTLSNQTFGVLFLATSAASTVLMYYLWGFPFDKERLKSEAPRSLLLLHRMLGYVYVAIYIYLMWQMVPRMWSYQVELPARTVAHLTTGLTIGALLLAKLAVVRFFKHLESALVPALGTALFVATVVLIGLALPFSLRETLLQRAALRGEVFSQERLDRVRRLLPITGLDDEATLARLATTDGLMSGRTILRTKCVQCHDLRTILARPRTPDSWRQTVRRMAQRSTILNPITEDDQWAVTAYLIAITPTLQQTVQLLRQQQTESEESQQAVEAASQSRSEVAYDSTAARQTFFSRCSQCHDPGRVALRPPATGEEAAQLVARMVGNGLVATEEDLAQIIRYITETYALAP